MAISMVKLPEWAMDWQYDDCTIEPTKEKHENGEKVYAVVNHRIQLTVAVGRLNECQELMR